MYFREWESIWVNETSLPDSPPCKHDKVSKVSQLAHLLGNYNDTFYSIGTKKLSQAIGNTDQLRSVTLDTWLGRMS